MTKETYKFLDELFFSALHWPVIIAGVYALLVDFLHFPKNWYTFFLVIVLSFYFAAKVERKYD